MMHDGHMEDMLKASSLSPKNIIKVTVQEEREAFSKILQALEKIGVEIGGLVEAGNLVSETPNAGKHKNKLNKV